MFHQQCTEGPTETEIHLRLYSPTTGGPPGVTLGQFFDAHFARGRKQASLRQYRTAINHLTTHCGRDPALSEIDNESIADCMRGQVDAGASPATANKTLRHLRAICHEAKRKKLIPEVPDQKPLREPKRIPRGWKIDQLSRLITSAKQVPGEICGITAWRWWFALILVLYDTGLRISAAMHLEWQHLDEKEEAIFVPAETQKQYADQILSLSSDCMEALRAIRTDRPLIFPWPYDCNSQEWKTLIRHLRKILKRAGLPESRWDLFHKFRKTNASHIKRGGGDPTQQLGHSSTKVTDRYLDPTITQQCRQVDLLPRPVIVSDDPQMRLF